MKDETVYKVVRGAQIESNAPCDLKTFNHQGKYTKFAHIVTVETIDNYTHINSTSESLYNISTALVIHLPERRCIH